MSLVKQNRSLYPWLMQDYLAIARDFSNDRLHHALLLSGNDGLGIEQLAQRLVELIHCDNPSDNKACGHCQQCLLHSSASHSDYYFVSALEGKAQISIEQVRQLSNKVHSTGLVSQKRIVVIDSIELMTESASNALLKILEEPPKQVFFVITTSKLMHLAPTILSRCFKVSITTPEINKTHGWLVKKTQKDINIAYISLLGNTPLKALEAVNNGFLPHLSVYLDLLNQLYFFWTKKQLNESFCIGIELIELFEQIHKNKDLNTNFELLIGIIQRFNQYVLKQQLIKSSNTQENLLSISLQSSLHLLPTTILINFSDRLADLNRIISLNSGVSISMQVGRHINDITECVVNKKDLRHGCS